MTLKEHAMVAFYQQRRERKQPVNDNDLADFDREYEASLEAIRREMAPIQACIDRR